MERATKLIICLLLLILMNYSTVFASAIDGLDYVLERDSQFYSFMDTEEYSEVADILSNYENIIIYKYESSITYLYVYSTNGSFIKQSNGQYKTSEASNFIRIYRYSDSGLWTYKSQYSSTGQAFVPTDILYTNSGVFDESGNIIVPPTSTYKEPYFEFALPLKGYTTLENVDGNIGAYTYTYVNTGISSVGNKYLKLGYLYIDQKYLISNLLTSTPQMTKYNLQMTSNWQYILYEGLYKTGIVQNGYTQYQIRIPTEYISTPNYYNIYFKSKDTNMQSDININFVLLNNQSTGNDGSGGGTSGGLGPIITPSGDTITGGEIENNTNIGDLENTLTEPYDPNKNILNEMDKEDILDNMGYQTTEDPNADLWDTIINGLKNTLTGSGNVTLELPLRTKTITINSNEITQPENALKTFTGLFVNFWLLMQMFTFIKKTIDQINEGNLKVMHDVDADCYFF